MLCARSAEAKLFRCAKGTVLVGALLWRSLVAAGAQESGSAAWAAAACGAPTARDGLLAVGFTLQREDGEVIRAIEARSLPLERALGAHFGYKALHITSVSTAAFGSASPTDPAFSQLFLIRFQACGAAAQAAGARESGGDEGRLLQLLLERQLNDGGERHWSVADVSIDWSQSGVPLEATDNAFLAAASVSAAVAILGIAAATCVVYRRRKRCRGGEPGRDSFVDIESGIFAAPKAAPTAVDLRVEPSEPTAHRMPLPAGGAPAVDDAASCSALKDALAAAAEGAAGEEDLPAGAAEAAPEADLDPAEFVLEPQPDSARVDATVEVAELASAPRLESACAGASEADEAAPEVMLPPPQVADPALAPRPDSACVDVSEADKTAPEVTLTPPPPVAAVDAHVGPSGSDVASEGPELYSL